MSVKSPKLVQLVVSAGIPESEVNQMSVDEFKAAVTAIREDLGNNFEEIQLKIEGKVPEPSKSIPTLIAPKINDVQVDPENFDNKNEDKTSFNMKQGITNDEIRKMKSMKDLAEEKGLENIEDLIEFRKSLVQSLKIPENTRYQDEINARLKEILPEDPSGLHVTLILHDGTKIIRSFSQEAPLSDIYYWAASQQNMIKGQIKLGSFVITNMNGTEIQPEERVSTISEKYVLLFVKLVF